MALMGQPSSEKINEQNCKQPQISLDTCDEIRIIEGKKKTSDRKLFLCTKFVIGYQITLI